MPGSGGWACTVARSSGLAREAGVSFPAWTEKRVHVKPGRSFIARSPARGGGARLCTDATAPSLQHRARPKPQRQILDCLCGQSWMTLPGCAENRATAGIRLNGGTPVRAGIFPS